MNIKSNIESFRAGLGKHPVKLIAVSKMNPAGIIKDAYDAGQKVFGENKVQELLSKYEVLPKDIEWHLIGHLQSNKVKSIASFVYMIHSVDSLKLLKEINKEGERNKRVILCLLQIHIAQEETKFGFSYSDAEDLLKSGSLNELKFIKIAGLMGMASNVGNENQIRHEFKELKSFFENAKKYDTANIEMKELSMGMSSDYKIAIEEGSTILRVGSAIFKG